MKKKAHVIVDNVIRYIAIILDMNSRGERMHMDRRYAIADELKVHWRTLYRYDNAIKKCLPSGMWNKTI